MRYATDRKDGQTDVQAKLETEHASVGLAHARLTMPICPLSMNSLVLGLLSAAVFTCEKLQNGVWEQGHDTVTN